MLSLLYHRYLFLFGLCALACGMMLGTVPTSVAQIILLCNWLLEMDFKRKWLALKSNLVFWLLSSVFLAHALGLLYTSDMETGWNDVRTKIPLMFLPMILMSTKTLDKKELHLVLAAFLLGSFLNTAWCYLYTFVLHKNEVVRSASRFMSHIRLGLYVNMAIACCVYFFIVSKKILFRSIFVFLVLYFLLSMYALGLASGIVNFMLLSVAAIIWLIYKMRVVVKVLLSLLLAAGIYLVSHYVYSIYDQQLSLKDSPVNLKNKQSIGGRNYFHFDNASQKENGYLVHINIQIEELQKEWNRRCPQDSFSAKPPHHLDRVQILLRYLSSKGLKKDSAAIWQLSDDDLLNIQANITNYQYPSWSYLHKRIYEAVNEMDEFSNRRQVNGHSLSMRLYFWSNAIHVINQNLFAGVGTGDVQLAMNRSFKETNTPISEEWYRRPHNQFLTVTVALGIFGFLIFWISLIHPFFRLKKYVSKLYYPFFVLAMISFFMEDTLETQAGVTFFAFFNSLFISLAYHKKHPQTPTQD